MSIWIVGKVTGPSWEFQGTFSSEERAIGACAGPEYFVAPAELDQELPRHSVAWPGVRFPHRPQS